ncbi:MAG TPA: fumarylacetoacetate hydrolase family protein, partial [Myxococcaceae bacterium]|nr:fumarylacetoacetate hydrolase family protein [Myxococcaceae bacterium]
MRFVRFRHRGVEHYGRLEGDRVVTLSEAPWGRPVDGPSVPLSDVELGVPTEPSKIVLVGVNYRQHAAEMGKALPEEPLIFTKPPSALNAHGRAIVLPPESREVHYEAELALVVGRRLKGATPAEAAQAVFGLLPFNDVTARDIQRREVQFTRAKGFDT